MDNYALAFSVSNLGPKSFQKVLSKFVSLKEAWNGTKDDYESIGIGNLTYKKFNEFRKSFDIEKYATKLQKENVIYIPYTNKQYPAALKKLENPPIGLFIKGNAKLLKSTLAIAVVGTRKVTQYGKSVTETLVLELVNNGSCIVSGLALGVDGVAHRTAVLNKGKTIAVLACGVDCCLPSENYSLYSNILENDGMIISEYPLSQPPNKGTFLARNRIVAALSDGILITEAAADSGSLVTAEWGFKLNKKVFAIPGPITSRMSDGSFKLLKQGAHLATEGKDVLQEFKIKSSKFKIESQKFKVLNISKEERQIVKLLENEPMTIDEIAKKTKLPVSKLFACLSNLELKAIIKNNRGEFALLVI